MRAINEFLDYKTYELPFGFKTSNVELKELFKAWLVISLIFTIASTGLSFNSTAIIFFLISAFTVGIGFLIHELSHKIMAQNFGASAEFRADNQMLSLALIMSVFGFLFIAPGAVFIIGRVNKKENGIISLAGPLSNFVLALIFLFFYFFKNSVFLVYGYKINSWLALFNMIPFGNFDGRKILDWNKGVYAFFAFLFLLFTFLF